MTVADFIYLHTVPVLIIVGGAIALGVVIDLMGGPK